MANNVLANNKINPGATMPSLANGAFALSQINGGNTQNLGQPAKSPEQNVSKPTNTLTPSQTKVQSTSSNKVTTPTSSKTFTDQQNQGLMAVLARQKAGTANSTDLQNLKYAQDNGWKASTTPTVQSAPSNNQITQNNSTNLKPEISTTGALSNLATGVVGNTAGTTTTNSANEGLLNLAKNNPGSSGDAYNSYQDTLTKIADLQRKMENTSAGINSSGDSLEVQTGMKGNLQSQYSGQLAALTQLANSQASALGYNISGQQTQQSALSSAGGLGQTQQSNLQSGLGSVVNSTNPITPGYNTPIYTRDSNGNLTLSNPGGTSGSAMSQLPSQAQQTIQNYAQQVKNNQLSRADAEARLSSYGQAGLNALSEALGSGFNTNISSGANSAQTNVAGQQAQQIQSWTSALQQGQNLKAQFTDLIGKFGLNPADLNAANVGLQKIASNVSDPNYQNFHNYVADIANTYAQILTPSGGSQTNQTRDIANSLLNSTMSGQGLLNVMQTLDEQAKAKIAGVSTSGGLGSTSSSNNSQFYW